MGLSKEHPSFHTLEYQKNALELPKEQNATLQELIRPHIESFNYFLDEGLRLILAHVDSKEYIDPNGNRIEYWIEDLQIGKPMRSDKDHWSVDRFIYPAEVMLNFTLRMNRRHKSHKKYLLVSRTTNFI
jgi:DNA-directed RNA polymerase beta subunit